MLMAPGEYDFLHKGSWVSFTMSRPLNEKGRCTKGAVDIPFSEASQTIFSDLLAHYKGAGTVCFDVFETLIHRFFIPEAHDTDLDWAIRLSNIHAVDKIDGSKEFGVRWRTYL